MERSISVPGSTCRRVVDKESVTIFACKVEVPRDEEGTAQRSIDGRLDLEDDVGINVLKLNLGDVVVVHVEKIINAIIARHRDSENASGRQGRGNEGEVLEE